MEASLADVSNMIRKAHMAATGETASRDEASGEAGPPFHGGPGESDVTTQVAFRMQSAHASACQEVAGSIAAKCADVIAAIARPSVLSRHGRRWRSSAGILGSAFFVASCVGAGSGIGPAGLDLPSGGGNNAQPAVTTPQPETGYSPEADPPAFTGGPNSETGAVSGDGSARAAAGPVPAGGTSAGGRRVSLRPRNNRNAADPLDHWGHRQTVLLSARLSEVPESGAEIGDFLDLLEDAREAAGTPVAPELRDEDTIAALGQRHGVAYGRWSGGPADRLSIEFDLEHATDEMRDDRAFRAALERAGKAWSHRIDDTWTAWERNAGESKGRLIGNYGTDGRDIRVAPGGETSTGLVIYMTGVTLGQNTAGRGGAKSIRPGDAWEPHTGVIALDKDYLETAGEASLFRTMVHEIGHVLGAWLGGTYMGRYAAFTDLQSGTWRGPEVVAVHGRPAPFQDRDDAHGWHDGERRIEAGNFDFGHSGVCTSVMAYCAHSAAIPAFLPAEIDFAFLADIGLTTMDDTDRPETYGFAGWLDDSAFTLSVSRELDVSLADPQPRYFGSGAKWNSLDTTDLLWAEADAFGNRSTGALAGSFPLTGTVRYSGGLVGAAVDYPGLPPVHGDASLSIGLESLAGKASFTSLRMPFNGERYIFGGGSLHYPITVADNAITHEDSGVSLVADFYGPRHGEVAGTLDDSRAGLLASFGAGHDERPSYLEVIAEADHVRGMTEQGGYSEDLDGWRRYRCGAGSGCEGIFEWWKPGSDWYDVPATEDRSPRERVLAWAGSWGDWMSEDLFADHGDIRLSRRYFSETDGGTGRYHKDTYVGTMEHGAFGTGFSRFVNWEGPDGEIWDFYSRGTGLQGDQSGSRPSGGATWEGRMIGQERGVAVGEDPFIQGRARVSASLDRNEVDIDFSGVTSMDYARSLPGFGFDGISLSSDGTFFGFDGGTVEGALFGPEHQEVAGMFQKNANNVIGSFGAVRQD